MVALSANVKALNAYGMMWAVINLKGLFVISVNTIITSAVNIQLHVTSHMYMDWRQQKIVKLLRLNIVNKHIPGRCALVFDPYLVSCRN